MGSTSQYFAFQATHPTPKGAASLVASGLLIYATRKPNGRLVWLTPSVLLFQVSAGGLFALSLAVAEGVVCLRRRKLSPLLLAATLTFILSRAIGISQFTGLGEEAVSISIFSAIFSSSHALLIAALRVLPFAIVVVCLLRLRDDGFDGTLRAGMLLLQLSVWTSLSAVLLGAPLDRYEPSVFVLTQAYSYLGAMLGFAIPIMIMSDLLDHQNRTKDHGSSNHSSVSINHARQIIIAGFVILLCFKGDYYIKYRDGVIRAVERGLSILVSPAGARPADPTIARLSFDDDLYLLRTSKWWQPADPLTYASTLKMLLRMEAGVFDESRVRIEILNENEKTAERPVSAEHAWVDH